MERLCLGKLSRAFVCSICSIGWSHRTVGNILKAELFLCFSWKSSKTMPSAIKPMTFFFYHWWNSYRESLQSCTQLNTDTSHNDVRKTIGQLPCWWQIMRSLGNYHELQEKKYLHWLTLMNVTKYQRRLQLHANTSVNEYFTSDYGDTPGWASMNLFLLV